MKVMRKLLLVMMITVLPVSSSYAAIAVGTLFVNPAAAGAIALKGLASGTAGVAAVILARDSAGLSQLGAAAFFLGVILLDENSENLSFSELSVHDAVSLGVNVEQIEIYNSEIHEVNILLEEVVSSLDDDSSEEDAKNIWLELKELVSPETFEVMQQVVSVR